MPPKDKGKRPLRPQRPELQRLIDADAGQSYSSTSSAESVRSEASCAPSAEYTVDTPATGHYHRRSRRFAVFAAVGSVVFGALLFACVLAVSFIPAVRERDLSTAFRYTDGRVDILDVSDKGVHVNVSMLGGVDTYLALGLEDGEAGSKAEVSANSAWSLWDTVRRSAAGAALGILPKQVAVTTPYVVVSTRAGVPLLNISLPNAIDMPLVCGDTELRPISVEALGKPLAPAGDLWAWAQAAWAIGTAHVVVDIDQATAAVGWIGISQYDLSIPLDVHIPSVPHLPPPGKPLDLSSLIALRSYSFASVNDELRITATATAPNPGLSRVPFALPFAILIGDETMAEVVAHASAVGEDEITVAIEGVVTGLVSASGASAGLSRFLQRFLHGRANPVTVVGLSSFRSPPSSAPAPPRWILDTLPSLALSLSFPAPPEPPRIVRDVTIEGMRVFESAGTMHAAGTVVARVQLPPGVENVNINITSISPDVFVFDGPVDTTSDSESDRPDPSNPPPRAFALINPDHYLSATTAPDPDGPPGALLVRAPFDDLALDVLPGRESTFRAFVAKVVFKGGANAGIDGVADVKASVGGADGVAVNNLPVRGEFWVGKARVWEAVLRH